MAAMKPNRNDAAWTEAAEAYLQVLHEVERLKEVLDERKAALVELYDEDVGDTNLGAGVSVNKSERIGSIAYKKAIEELGLDEQQFEAFRGKSSTVFTVKEVVKK